MKRPTPASLKRVTPENLARLGVERLSQILIATAEMRPELKRRLRMELAAEQGADHLAVEIDKRLDSLETSRSKISWRKRATFVGDLDVLRVLIAERLAGLDAPDALDRMWRFMGLARQLGMRVRDRDGALGEVFVRAAQDIGRLLADAGAEAPAKALVEAMARDPASWAEWLPLVLAGAEPAFAGEVLRWIAQAGETTPRWLSLARCAADAAQDVDAFQATFTSAELHAPALAADVARRLLAAGRVADAGRVLEAAAPGSRNAATEPNFDWESAWIDYLDRAGRPDAAQAARWASFERTLSVERVRAFVRRLTGFDDVEAETRALEYAAAHPDFERALQVLIEWPAYAQAAQMIASRPADAVQDSERAELWAGKLRVRQPAAAHALLRRAAAAAFKRRDFKTSDRLSQEADSIDLPAG